MNLWIRSQKREGLFNFDRLWYYYDEEENKHCICNYEFEFGTYKSKERALEVLDEIQNAILGVIANEDVEKQGVKKYTGNAILSKLSNNIVYEMPKE